MIKDITEIIDMDICIKEVSFASNDNVVPPIPTFCDIGDKPFSRLFYIKKGGIFICSGIILPRLDEVKKALEKYFTIESIEKSADWAAVKCRF